MDSGGGNSGCGGGLLEWWGSGGGQGGRGLGLLVGRLGDGGERTRGGGRWIGSLIVGNGGGRGWRCGRSGDVGAPLPLRAVLNRTVFVEDGRHLYKA